MKRREFLETSISAAGVPFVGGGEPADAEYYELRQYHMLYGAKQQALHDFLSKAAIPAWNRLGVRKVGVFSVVYGTSSPSLYVLLVHPDVGSVTTLRDRLAEDAGYLEAGRDFLQVPMTEPAYVRFESSLLRAFSEMPALEVPVTAPRRVFELRRYESHSEAAALRKIEMFNRGGEIPIFRRTGLHPVFFAEMLIGPNLPNLTYMLSFESLADRDEAWSKFGQDPDWQTLSKDAYYADTVSSISDLILRPTAYSQI